MVGTAALAAEAVSASREESEKNMGTRLYVGNLPFDVDETQLRGLFEKDGRQVTEVKIIMDRDTGRPRGFAFVEMGSQADASSAISALNGPRRRADRERSPRVLVNRGGGPFAGADWAAAVLLRLSASSPSLRVPRRCRGT
jgi:RNA recognition motif-containing protein